MELRLIVVGGRASRDAVTLTPPVVIGRSREAQLTVAHPMISRRHCEIREVDGLLLIRDLGSLNGTVVEGQRIEEAPLCPGNEFSLGPLTFRAEYDYQGDPESVPAAKVVDQGGSHPPAASTEETPDCAGVDELAQSPPVEPPPSMGAWDQTATEAVHQPEQEDVVEIEQPRGAEQEDRGGEPPPQAKQQTVVDDPKPAPLRDERLDEFLDGLR